MPDSLRDDQIRSVLQTIGERLPTRSRLTLIGGGALSLLGSPRPTIDLDFIGDDLSPSDLDKAIVQIAQELNIYAEPVPLERFIPLPAGSADRAIFIAQFGNLEVYVTDPYSLALSKLDRGFDTDLDDIVFLIQHGFVELTELARLMEQALKRAHEFDIDPNATRAHLQIVHGRLN